MMEALNKYEVLLASIKWNAISPKRENIMATTTVIEKLKYDNLKLSKSYKKSSKKVEGKGKLSQ